jgi:hypothetical protein
VKLAGADCGNDGNDEAYQDSCVQSEVPSVGGWAMGSTSVSPPEGTSVTGKPRDRTTHLWIAGRVR